MQKFFIKLAVASTCLLAGLASAAEIVVVVNPKNPATRMFSEQASQFFLGKSTMFVPLDQAEKSQIRADFYQRLAGKDISQVKAACDRIKRIAPTPATVLLSGESGTGKEVAARALHRMSQRAKGPFVPVNCAAIAAELIESELFGHVRGAYTGAQQSREGLFYYARGGTLFLDEISELPLADQAKLLRALEERRIRPVGSEQEIAVDVRVIAATNRDLKAEVAGQRFRQDLYYRLQVLEVTLPPLRERPEDIAPLLAHFIAQLAPHLGVPPLVPDARTLSCLAAYDWPGNVRELRNFVERSLILGWFDICTGEA